jgi:uncharacterized protein (DUF488 family)
MEFFTIGVYNSTEDEFFGKLTENRIDTFCDIRQRRGVRGAKYSFVNSQRLQAKLGELDIKYGHVLALAPTTEIRDLQKEADAQLGVQKKDRTQLGKIFQIAYKDKVLKSFDLDALLEQLENAGTEKVVLFCVEEHHRACHRSIVADKIQQKYDLEVTHL